MLLFKQLGNQMSGQVLNEDNTFTPLAKVVEEKVVTVILPNVKKKVEPPSPIVNEKLPINLEDKPQ